MREEIIRFPNRDLRHVAAQLRSRDATMLDIGDHRFNFLAERDGYAGRISNDDILVEYTLGEVKKHLADTPWPDDDIEMPEIFRRAAETEEDAVTLTFRLEQDDDELFAVIVDGVKDMIFDLEKGLQARDIMNALVTRYPKKDRSVLSRYKMAIEEINRQIDAGKWLNQNRTFDELQKKDVYLFEMDKRQFDRDIREIKKTGLVKDSKWFRK